MRLVGREDRSIKDLAAQAGKGGGVNADKALEEELAEIKAELQKAYGMVRSAFVYYSLAGSELPQSSSLYKLTANDWSGFCYELGLATDKPVSGSSPWA